MSKIQSYKDLIAWQKAMDLVEMVYRLSARFPHSERFGLISQVRRAAVSVPSNIAEGFGRAARSDFIRFLDIALGSANEVETQLLAATRLNFITERDVETALDLVSEIQRIVKGLVRGLKSSSKSRIRE